MWQISKTKFIIFYPTKHVVYNDDDNEKINDLGNDDKIDVVGNITAIVKDNKLKKF